MPHIQVLFLLQLMQLPANLVLSTNHKYQNINSREHEIVSASGDHLPCAPQLYLSYCCMFSYPSEQNAEHVVFIVLSLCRVGHWMPTQRM